MLLLRLFQGRERSWPLVPPPLSHRWCFSRGLYLRPDRLFQGTQLLLKMLFDFHFLLTYADLDRALSMPAMRHKKR